MGAYEDKKPETSDAHATELPRAPAVGRQTLVTGEQPERAGSTTSEGRYKATFDPRSIRIPWSTEGAGSQSAVTSTVEHRVREQMQLLDQQVELVASRMNKRASMGRDEIEVLRLSIDAGESLLRSTVTELEPGSPMEQQASAVLAKSRDTRALLAAFGNGNDAHQTTEREFGANDGSDHYARAKERNQGFCDLGPQNSLCTLTEKERQDFRAGVRASVSLIANNWRQAITSSYINEMFRERNITFEQQLGQIIFSVLFNVITTAGKAGVVKGIDRAERAASTGVMIEGQWNKVTGPDMTEGRLVATRAIEKAAAKTEIAAITHERRVGTIRAIDLAIRAADSVTMPADRAAFLASLEDAPGNWEATIYSQLKDLFDEDLNTLADRLPELAPRMTTSSIKKEIETQMTRFEHEVLAVTPGTLAETRAVQVVGGHGPVRYALARRKLAPNPSLHGEWKNSPTRTDKWTFVEWIGDDMKYLAVRRSMALPGGGLDVSAAAMIRSETDTTFWDEESLPKLATTPPKHSPPWGAP